MATWTDEELRRAGSAGEPQLASRRGDGTLRPYVTMWVVHAGVVERDVIFGDAPPDAHAGIDAAYHAKYDRYGPAVVESVVGDKAASVMIRLVPDS
jgi:hypothetical protein